MDIQEIIKAYDLSPHPEGGYFKEVYRSDTRVDSPAVSAPRHAATHIYFLLARGQVSRFHRVAHDELWHFYQGDPLGLLQYDGTRIRTEIIGPETGYMAVVPGNVWQAAETCGTYSLVGCTVAPGFDFADFSFLRDTPDDLAGFNDPGFRRFL